MSKSVGCGAGRMLCCVSHRSKIECESVGFGFAIRVLVCRVNSWRSGENRMDEVKKELQQANQNPPRSAKADADNKWSDIVDRVSVDLLDKESFRDGVPTGFAELDRRLGGLRRGDMIVIASCPFMGKSALAMNILEHAALGHAGGKKHTVGVFCLESSQEKWAGNMLFSMARVPAWKDFFSQSDVNRISSASEQLTKASVVVEDSTWMDVADLCERARQMKRVYGIDLLAIDSLQELDDPLSAGNGRKQENEEIAKGINALAKELNIPILLVSQFGRSADQPDSNGRICPYELSELGDIERYADVVMLLCRPSFCSQEADDVDDALAVVKVTKNRNGCRGRADMNFHCEFMRFEDRANVFE